jgi:hypothetical protein
MSEKRGFQAATSKISEKVSSIVEDVKSFVVGDEDSSRNRVQATPSPQDGGLPRDPPVVRDLPVTIEELFRGCAKRMKITK